MNKFIKNVFLFLSTLAFCLMMNFLINLLIIRVSPNPLGGTKTLIIGDSHTEKSLDPTMFDSTMNISQPGETIINSYWKLKHLLPISEVKTVVLAVSHHNLSKNEDLKYLKEGWSLEFSRRLYSIKNFTSSSHVDYNKENYAKVFLRRMFLFPRINHDSYIGNYDNDKTYSSDDYERAIHRHYYYSKQHKFSGESKNTEMYLEKIIELCDDLEIRLIMVACPVHEEYYKRIPRIIHRSYDLFKKDHSLDEIYDYSQYPLDEKCYLNSDHLNEKGANVFSEVIKKTINNN